MRPDRIVRPANPVAAPHRHDPPARTALTIAGIVVALLIGQQPLLAQPSAPAWSPANRSLSLPPSWSDAPPATALPATAPSINRPAPDESFWTPTVPTPRLTGTPHRANESSGGPSDQSPARVGIESEWPRLSGPVISGGGPVVPTGRQLIDQAIYELKNQPELSALIRVRTDLLGGTVFGAGRYTQVQTALVRQVRLELAIGPEDAPVATLLQVANRDDVWTEWKTPQQTRIERIRLAKLRNVQASSQDGVASTTSAWDAQPAFSTTSLANGGLARLVESIAASHEFRPPVPSDLQGLPVWTVEGIRADLRSATVDASGVSPRSASLARLGLTAAPGPPTSPLPASRMKADEVTTPGDVRTDPYVPTHVRLSLRRDAQLNLFPHRVEFLRASDVADAGRAWDDGDAFRQESDGPGVPVVSPLVRFDFYNVSDRADITPTTFAFDPAGARVIDRTDDALAGRP